MDSFNYVEEHAKGCKAVSLLYSAAHQGKHCWFFRGSGSGTQVMDEFI
jgi:hypothetical protein